MSEHHAALIYSMVLASAADRDMTDAELVTIGEIVRHLPVFSDFDGDGLPGVASQCSELLNSEGLDAVLDAIRESLPDRLRETAYALACDVVAADGAANQEELRLLELFRHRVGIGRLPAAAIERGAAARYRS